MNSLDPPAPRPAPWGTQATPRAAGPPAIASARVSPSSAPGRAVSPAAAGLTDDSGGWLRGGRHWATVGEPRRAAFGVVAGCTPRCGAGGRPCGEFRSGAGGVGVERSTQTGCAPAPDAARAAGRATHSARSNPILRILDRYSVAAEGRARSHVPSRGGACRPEVPDEGQKRIGAGLAGQDACPGGTLPFSASPPKMVPQAW